MCLPPSSVLYVPTPTFPQGHQIQRTLGPEERLHCPIELYQVPGRHGTWTVLRSRHLARACIQWCSHAKIGYVWPLMTMEVANVSSSALSQVGTHDVFVSWVSWAQSNVGQDR